MSIFFLLKKGIILFHECDILGLYNRVYEKVILPVRNEARKQRKKMKDSMRVRTEKVYTFVKTTGLLIRPFLGASLLYFDICKDLMVASIIFKSLGDLVINFLFLF